MRCLFGATIVICGLALLPGGCAQAAPPESQEQPAAADDDRPPRLQERQSHDRTPRRL